MKGGIALLRKGLAMPNAYNPTTNVILVVEDEFLLRDMIAGYLRESGCTVFEASSAEQAIDYLDTKAGHEIDVVFTDIGLSGPLNGWDVGEAYRAARSDISVIYASGIAREQSRQVSGSMFVNKPYDPDKILRACNALCRKH
jgi:two-component system, OmpR family, response regulator